MVRLQAFQNTFRRLGYIRRRERKIAFGKIIVITHYLLNKLATLVCDT